MELSLGHAEFLRVFQEIVRVRESVFRFGEVGTALARDPAAEVNRLFDHFVERQFARHEDYQENVMAKRYARTLRARDILGYDERRLGNDLYHVTIPLVKKFGEEPTAVRGIKPLDLAKREPTRIIEHGDHWLARIHHLRGMNYDPAAFMFPVRMPPHEPRKTRAAEQVCGLLEATGVRVLRQPDDEAVIRFATVA